MKILKTTFLLAAIIFTIGCGPGKSGEDRRDTATIDSGNVVDTRNVDSLQMNHTTDSSITDNSGNGGSKLKQ